MMNGNITGLDRNPSPLQHRIHHFVNRTFKSDPVATVEQPHLSARQPAESGLLDGIFSYIGLPANVVRKSAIVSCSYGIGDRFFWTSANY